MCLEWLVVRPLASIKSTTELLLVMADILTALGGTGAGANTHVFEVKHGEISQSHLHKCAHTHTHTHRVLLCTLTHSQLMCYGSNFVSSSAGDDGNC